MKTPSPSSATALSRLASACRVSRNSVLRRLLCMYSDLQNVDWRQPALGTLQRKACGSVCCDEILIVGAARVACPIRRCCSAQPFAPRKGDLRIQEKCMSSLLSSLHN